MRSIEHRSLRYPGGPAPATRLGVPDKDLPQVVELAAKTDLGVITLDLLYTDNWPVEKRLLPQQVEVRKEADGRTIVSEFFPDRGSCSEHPIGILREVPFDDKTGKPVKAKTTYLRVGSSDAFERAILAFNKKRYAEAFRLIGHAMSWSAMMRNAIHERVYRAIESKKYEKQLPRIRIKQGAALGLLAEPHPEALQVTPIVGTGGDDLLRLSAVDPKDPNYRRIDADGEWDLVLHLPTRMVGFIRRGPDLTEAPRDAKG